MSMSLSRIEAEVIHFSYFQTNPANDACGSRIHQLEDPFSSALSNGFDHLCYIGLNDTSLSEVRCKDLLQDLQGEFVDSAALTAGGGRFGCYRSTNGLNDPRRYDACQAGHDTSAVLSDCSSCTHMFVCVDYPGSPKY